MSEVAPEVSVVVTNWNGERWLHACLASLKAQAFRDFETIVVDNGSTDGSCALVRALFPDARLIELSENRGFAGGSNAGARAARGRWLAFLNNDAMADPGWLAALHDALAAAGRPAFATSRIVLADRPDLLDSAGDGWLRVGAGFKHGHGGPAVRHGISREVFGACGAACMIGRDTFLELGGFDEAFFLVFEDVDLSYRARLRGNICLYVPSALVRHAGSATLGRASARSVYFGQRNLEWVYLKNTPAPLLLRSAPGHLVYTLAAALFFLRRGRFRSFLAGKAAALRGLRAVLRQRAMVQRRRSVTSEALWASMTPGWLSTKRREKAPLPPPR